jgi:hypothetical protein
MRPLVAMVLVGSLFCISWAAAAVAFAAFWGDTTPLRLAGFLGALGALGIVWASQHAPIWVRPRW